MKCIDCFVDQRRQWELEHAKPDPIPLPVGRPALNLEKPRIVQGHFSEKKNINVLLHHSSRFSYEDFFHCHDFFEMIYLYRGNCTQRFPDEDLLMSQHDILLLNPNTIHAPYTTADEDCMFNILISKSLFERSMSSLVSDSQILSTFIVDCLYQVSKARDYLYFSLDKESDSKTTIETLIAEHINRDYGYQKIMESLLSVLFAQLSREYIKQNHLEQLQKTNSSRTISEILAYICENAPTISLQELSDYFNYSTAYLSRLIRQHTGKTYSEIVQKFKIEKARHYLANSDLPIAEIIRLSGFSAAHYFYRIFKERYLMTPAEYRKSIIKARE